MAQSRKSEIPVGTQFAPTLINLPEFLKAIIQHSGDKVAMQANIFKSPVHLKRSTAPSSRRTASLPLEAAVQYGLLTPRTYQATELSKKLATLQDDELYRQFAKHILLNLNGLRVIEAIQQMYADIQANLSITEITGDTLARYLSDNGLNVTEHNTAINTMRLWLAKAGIFQERTSRVSAWSIDSETVENILGIKNFLLSDLDALDEPQRAFVRALCKINPTGWIKASQIRDFAEKTDQSKVIFSRVSLPQRVLEPLKVIGLIEWRSRGTQGGKAAEMRTTDKFDAEVLEPFLERVTSSLDPIITKYYKMRSSDLYAALNSTNTAKKGEALEAYAIHLMRLLGLNLIAWRKRAKDATGQAEVDALMAGVIGGIATTWQVQCKNTPNSRVTLEDIAKEVGIAVTTGATHILFVTNGEYTNDARTFANKTMSGSSLSMYLLDKRDFNKVKSDPSALAGIIDNQSREVVRNRLQRPSWYIA
jgi:hypothetical protein